MSRTVSCQFAKAINETADHNVRPLPAAAAGPTSAPISNFTRCTHYHHYYNYSPKLSSIRFHYLMTKRHIHKLRPTTGRRPTTLTEVDTESVLRRYSSPPPAAQATPGRARCWKITSQRHPSNISSPGFIHGSVRGKLFRRETNVKESYFLFSKPEKIVHLHILCRTQQVRQATRAPRTQYAHLKVEQREVGTCKPDAPPA